MELPIINNFTVPINQSPLHQYSFTHSPAFNQPHKAASPKLLTTTPNYLYNLIITELGPSTWQFWNTKTTSHPQTEPYLATILLQILRTSLSSSAVSRWAASQLGSGPHTLRPGRHPARLALLPCALPKGSGNPRWLSENPVCRWAALARGSSFSSVCCSRGIRPNAVRPLRTNYVCWQNLLLLWPVANETQ